jgi:peptide/nickel transport system substrate-binding protein
MEEQTAQPKNSIRWLPIYSIFSALVLFLLVIIVATHLLSPKTQIKGADYIEGLSKDEVKIGIIAPISGRYPNIPFDVDSFALNSGVFEGLTIIRQGRLQSGLAESWTNPDKLTWRIKLRDTKFQSGDKLKASDVAYTIEEAKKNTSWVSNFTASRVDQTNVIDDRTIELKTKNPDPTLLYWLAYMLVLSQDQVKKDGLDKAVGTGPYTIASISDKEAVLEADQTYWGGQPKVKKIVYRAYGDAEKAAQALLDGETDITFLFNGSQNSKFKDKDFRIVASPFSDVDGLGFDTNREKAVYVNTDKNPFKDLRVRKAILLTLDVNELLKASQEEGTALTQFSSPALVGFNTSLTRPKVDREQAKKLLAEAGFPAGFTVTLDVRDTRGAFPEEVKKQLATIGINVTINKYSSIGKLIKRIITDSSFYDIGYVPDTLDSLDLLNSFFHTADDKGNGFNNLSSYQDKDLDALLDQAAKVFDAGERAKLTANINKEVMAKLPIVPLVTRVGFFVVRNNVAFKPAPFDYIFGVELSGREKSTAVK